MIFFINPCYQIVFVDQIQSKYNDINLERKKISPPSGTLVLSSRIRIDKFGAAFSLVPIAVSR
jgi:hypothetical protein